MKAEALKKFLIELDNVGAGEPGYIKKQECTLALVRTKSGKVYTTTVYEITDEADSESANISFYTKESSSVELDKEQIEAIEIPADYYKS